MLFPLSEVVDTLLVKQRLNERDRLSDFDLDHGKISGVPCSRIAISPVPFNNIFRLISKCTSIDGPSNDAAANEARGIVLQINT